MGPEHLLTSPDLRAPRGACKAAERGAKHLPPLLSTHTPFTLTSLARPPSLAPQGLAPRIVLHPTRPLVFTGCMDGSVRCWDVRSGECVRTWQGHRAGVQDLAVSPDGSMLITGGDDFTARVFALDGA